MLHINPSFPCQLKAGSPLTRYVCFNAPRNQPCPSHSVAPPSSLPRCAHRVLPPSASAVLPSSPRATAQQPRGDAAEKMCFILHNTHADTAVVCMLRVRSYSLGGPGQGPRPLWHA